MDRLPPLGFGGILGGGPVPDVQMPDGLPVSGGKGSPLVDAFLALQGGRLRDAVTAPRDAYTGALSVFGPDGHPTDEAIDRASGLAGLAMTGSMPFKAPAGALRSFGGAASKAEDDILSALEAGLADYSAKYSPPVPPPSDGFMGAPRPLIRQGRQPLRVDPAAESWDLYHGSTPGPDFQRFDPNFKPRHSESGAVFFAPDPETAAMYAGQGTETGEAGSRIFRTKVEPGKTGVFDIGHLAETDPTFNARAREILTSETGHNTGTSFDLYMDSLRSGRARDREIGDQMRAMGYEPIEPQGAAWMYGHIGAAVERAKAQGLDTAILRGLAEHGGDDQVIALTPGRVRSFYAPDQVLYSGGPASAAGLPFLGVRSDERAAPLAPLGQR